MDCWWRARARERPERPAPIMATLGRAAILIYNDTIFLKVFSEVGKGDL
jgi:hypothetical protein